MKIDYLDAPSEDVRIEILPLIDVIFCILTFFILAAVGLTRQQAIDLDLPAATTGAPLPPQGIGADAQLRERLYVSVDAIGQVYLDQQPVTVDLLYDVLLQHQQSYPEGLIVLYASRDARYEDVVNVLDLLRSVGGNRVALATLPNALTNPQDLLEDDLLLPQPNLDGDSFSDDLLTPQPNGLGSPGTDFPGTLDDEGMLLPQPGLNPDSNNPELQDESAE
jgi:biopolymer transport protein ExbD